MGYPQEIEYIFIFFIWLKYVWELFLDIRQYRKCKTTQTIPPEVAPVITLELFERTRTYRLGLLRYSFLKKIFFALIDTGILLGGVFARMWKYIETISPSQDELVLSCFWTLAIATLYVICKSLIHTYKVFAVENKHGFGQSQSGCHFVCSEFGTLIFDAISAVALVALCVAGYRWCESWFWLYLWATLMTILTFFMAIWPAYIAPTLDKFEPFPEGPLKTELEALAASAHLPLAGIKLIRGAKTASHSYSYVYGSRKVYFVVYDVLILPEGAGCQNDEIVAILAHEVGHKKGCHQIKLLLILAVQISFMIFIFFVLIPGDLIYRSVGFGAGVRPIAAGLALVVLFVMPISNLYMEYPENYIRRQLEHNADDFSKKMQRGDALRRALIKLYKDNIAFPVDDRFYYSWYYDHPTLLERIKQLNR